MGVGEILNIATFLAQICNSAVFVFMLFLHKHRYQSTEIWVMGGGHTDLLS